MTDSFLERVASAMVAVEPWCHAPRCHHAYEVDDLRVILLGEPESAAPVSQLSILCPRHAEALRP